MRAANPDMRRELLERAYEGYSRSYESQGKTSYYTGINAATMALMLGKDTEAITRAIEVCLLVANACTHLQRAHTRPHVACHRRWNGCVSRSFVTQCWRAVLAQMRTCTGSLQPWVRPPLSEATSSEQQSSTGER